MPTFEQVPHHEVPEKLRQQAAVAADRAARDLGFMPQFVWWRKLSYGEPRRYCIGQIEERQDNAIGFVRHADPNVVHLVIHQLDDKNIDRVVLHECRHCQQLKSGRKDIDLEKDAERYADEAKSYYRQTTKEFVRMAPPPAAEQRTGRVMDPQELARLRKMAADSLKKRGLQRGGIEIRAFKIPKEHYQDGKLPADW